MSYSSTRPSILGGASDRIYLSDGHIRKDHRHIPASARRASSGMRGASEMDEIEANKWNLNISRYVSTAEQEVAIDLTVTHQEFVEIEKQIQESTAKHNAFLKELGLPPLPAPNE